MDLGLYQVQHNTEDRKKWWNAKFPPTTDKVSIQPSAPSARKPRSTSNGLLRTIQWGMEQVQRDMKRCELGIRPGICMNLYGREYEHG
ncbi:hypothetical protein T265_09159 [Opisthorchis viverrini]|uniref:Uncharacterized protein n=1 Tax=Opisthorchis viverrini TaxID=6198 RepID=A0A074Z6L0_OPIVI|nr:hypothetical protein T265_09159 [Opisthorchis viverrini]KER22821.1 hypothetical protein T265_09159 [Opisthorchis viverrini]